VLVCVKYPRLTNGIVLAVSTVVVLFVNYFYSRTFCHIVKKLKPPKIDMIVST